MISFWLYQNILYPSISFLISFFAFFQKNKKWAQFYFERKSPQFQKIRPELFDKKKPIWIHASSGEIEYARPVLRELKKLDPSLPLLVTYSSLSAKKILAGLAEIDAWGPSPWDSRLSVQKFLDEWKPQLALFARTDVWPQVSYQLSQRQIPSLLFSATLADNSSRKGVGKSLQKFCLSHLTKIMAVSEDDLKNFQELGLENVEVKGDTRFDQVFYRLENAQKIRTELKPSNASQVFVAGSIWPEDEEQIIPVIKKNPGLKFILAPHEVSAESIKKLEEDLRSRAITFTRYSMAEKWERESVLIVDKVGVLAEIYPWGRFAFVGGSFRRLVHSVMEPLAAGLFTFVGPHHQNNREALLFQSKFVGQTPLVQVVHSSDELDQKLKNLLTSSNLSQGEITQYLQDLTGSTKTVVEWIRWHLH